MFKPRRISSSVTAPWPRDLPWPLPAVARERHAPASQEHTFLLEQDTLGQHAPVSRPETDPAPGIDDAMPRQSRRAASQQQANHARMARPAEPTPDLAIGRHPPTPDPADQPPGPPAEVRQGATSPNCSSYSREE